MISQIKTVILLGALTGILLFIGSFFGQGGLTIALVFSVLMNFGAYFFADKIILMMYKAKEVSKNEHKELHEIVEEIAKKMEIPKPRIFLIPSEHLNAFATGRSPKNGVVAFTKGIINKLSNNELRGVAAHELAHIKNRDILITTIAATIAGVISYAASMARFAAIFGSNKDRNSGNLFALIALSLIAPIAALILQLAISRAREYLADERGARTIKDSEALARALEKIHSAARSHPLTFGSPATSSLFIINPFSGSNLLNLFSTHPPLEERIERLRTLRI